MANHANTQLPRESNNIRVAAGRMVDVIQRQYGKELAHLAAGARNEQPHQQLMAEASLLANLRGRFSPAAALAVEVGGYMLSLAGEHPQTSATFIL